MYYFWLIFTFTWLGGARPQYINTGGPNLLDTVDHQYFPLPYIGYFNLPNIKTDYDPLENNALIDTYNRFSLNDLYDDKDASRIRRTVEDKELTNRRWMPNLVDSDKTFYVNNDVKDKVDRVMLQEYLGIKNENNTDKLDVIHESEIDKRSFSPWGGKRGGSAEQTWTWKRSANMKEPSMPKRVRFSPWGGKRSGQVIYKPGLKGSKIIFSSSAPELTKIISNYSPNGETMNLAGFQILPFLDKRHPMRILALSAKVDGGPLSKALPFKDFAEMFPKFFKPGHPYVDMDIKKDGKRKVKFSVWGGKRSPPIIGPIWTPELSNLKEFPIHAIHLIKDIREYNSDTDQTTKANK